MPLVGIVSMDTATFDVTDAPAAVEGGLLELIGSRNPIDALAADAGTIGYEILTSLGRRFARAYADLRNEISRAATAFAEDVKAGRFPDEEHSYS